jgi:hypothetical protein
MAAVGCWVHERTPPLACVAQCGDGHKLAAGRHHYCSVVYMCCVEVMIGWGQFARREGAANCTFRYYHLALLCCHEESYQPSSTSSCTPVHQWVAVGDRFLYTLWPHFQWCPTQTMPPDATCTAPYMPTNVCFCGTPLSAICISTLRCVYACAHEHTVHG